MITMEMRTLKYQVMGKGMWITATVSRVIAEKLAFEYQSYGWPVEVCAAEQTLTFDLNAA
ncbi:hypothetical protein [Vibrio splendidus]|uniref:hypothetical protein n=1 Tax=Vibrio splendidus TaxID=29497 RepID=UPI0021B218A0|nr:hypothetical protein [Vibrio splendidus]UXA00886.1 hypothetical protein IM698_20615 [Vibrio splendidus]